IANRQFPIANLSWPNECFSNRQSAIGNRQCVGCLFHPVASQALVPNSEFHVPSCIEPGDRTHLAANKARPCWDSRCPSSLSTLLSAADISPLCPTESAR